MNTAACRRLLARVSGHIKDANDLGIARAQLTTLDLVWTLHLAMSAVRAAEQYQRGMDQLNKIIGDDQPPVPADNEVLQGLDLDEVLIGHLFEDNDDRTTPSEPKTHDHEMLQEVHSMVAAMCQKLGDDPLKVPCDLWRLQEHIETLVVQKQLLVRALLNGGRWRMRMATREVAIVEGMLQERAPGEDDASTR